MRRALALLSLLVLAALAAGLAGCGGRFALPNEVRNISNATDSSYKMQAIWTGMTDIRDILLTQGSGTQLFLLFNHDPDHLRTGTDPRGEVLAYARMKPDGPQPPIPGIVFSGLFNPVALCSGGDGASSAANRIFILDEGDTTLARVNPETHIYGDTTGLSTTLRGKWGINDVSDVSLYWHVREYGLLGQPYSTFSDTTMAWVNGVAADDQGRVYVSGIVIVWVRDIQNPSKIGRYFQWRINRYLRGAGTSRDTVGMVGPWHHDMTWMVEEGSGTGYSADPRGLFWGPAGGGALYSAENGKNWVQKLSDQLPSTGLFSIDGKTTPDPQGLTGPVDVSADLSGFIYIADAGNQRVLRYDGSGSFVQVVNVDVVAAGSRLQNPITVAADDSLVFVGDPQLSEVLRYKRRK
jgi:hypothetical protein